MFLTTRQLRRLTGIPSSDPQAQLAYLNERGIPFEVNVCGRPWVPVNFINNPPPPSKRRVHWSHIRDRQTPPWADIGEIESIYRLARLLSDRTGVRHHVDHYYPLRGAQVSGLHVANNLRVIPALDNARKKNRYEP